MADGPKANQLMIRFPVGKPPYKEANMTAIADRRDLRLSVEDKNRLRSAAELHGCRWPPLSAKLPCARG